MEQQNKLSVNFHLWEPCNMKCGFCFAGFKDVKRSILPAGHLNEAESAEVVKQLAEFGFGKITFAGGEPTLCPWLNKLIAIAKNDGMTSMLVTNGSRLSNELLLEYQRHLDWIALSIDSICADVNLKSGRHIGKRLMPERNYYAQLINNIHRLGFKFKINTVVNQFNKDEVMSDFIIQSQPLRWKIFKVLEVANQNGSNYSSFNISDEEFSLYLKNNLTELTQKILVTESNEEMRGSYLMIDPAGRFYDTSTGTNVYSKSILEVGVNSALSEITFDKTKFIERGGLYDWE